MIMHWVVLDPGAFAQRIQRFFDAFRANSRTLLGLGKSGKPAEIADWMVALLTNPAFRHGTGRADRAKLGRFIWLSLDHETAAAYHTPLEERRPAYV